MLIVVTFNISQLIKKCLTKFWLFFTILLSELCLEALKRWEPIRIRCDNYRIKENSENSENTENTKNIGNRYRIKKKISVSPLKICICKNLVEKLDFWATFQVNNPMFLLFLQFSEKSSWTQMDHIQARFR